MIALEGPDRQLVLLVEDDPLHSELFLMAWNDAGLLDDVVVAGDADRAFDLLRAPRTVSRAPALVLLDLNLPGRTGVEILAEIRSDPRLHDLRVVIFSTSSAPADHTMAEQLGADDYVTKPFKYRDLVHVVTVLAHRWLGTGSPDFTR